MLVINMIEYILLYDLMYYTFGEILTENILNINN